jgi:hypothetical protein
MPTASALARNAALPPEPPKGSRRPRLKLVAVEAPNDSVAAILSMGTADATDAIHDAFRRSVEGKSAPTKQIMRAINCNERTAENLYAGKNMPSALYLLRAMAAFPEFAAEVRRLTAMHASITPDFERAFNAAQIAFAKFYDKD